MNSKKNLSQAHAASEQSFISMIAEKKATLFSQNLQIAMAIQNERILTLANEDFKSSRYLYALVDVFNGVILRLHTYPSGWESWLKSAIEAIEVLHASEKLEIDVSLDQLNF